MDFKELENQGTQSNVAKNRITLLLLAVVFIAPVLFAYLAYFNGWLAGGVTNKGEIIAEPWHFEDLAFEQSFIKDWQQSPYHGKWNWLLVLDDAHCGQECQINWFLLQQTQLGLAKHQKKVSWLLVLNQNTQSLTGEWQAVDFAKAEMSAGQIPVTATTLKGLNNQSLPANHIYLMDPLGSIFMRYELVKNKADAPTKSKDLRTDILRVLKYLDVSKKDD